MSREIEPLRLHNGTSLNKKAHLELHARVGALLDELLKTDDAEFSVRIESNMVHIKKAGDIDRSSFKLYNKNGR